MLNTEQALTRVLQIVHALDEDEAAATIVRGFLNVDIMGLPAPLKKAMDEQISLLEAGNAM